MQENSACFALVQVDLVGDEGGEDLVDLGDLGDFISIFRLTFLEQGILPGGCHILPIFYARHSHRGSLGMPSGSHNAHRVLSYLIVKEL